MQGSILSAAKANNGTFAGSIRTQLSLTDTDPLCEPTLLTSYKTTPMEFTVTSLAACLPQDIMSSSTAQAFTVVHAWAGLVAQTSLGAHRVQLWFPLTEVR